MTALRVALVGGPMYDDLYRLLPDDVEIVVHADHPTLNRRVAELLAAGERIDLLSTHSKYAPSQAQWLQPLVVHSGRYWAPTGPGLGVQLRDEAIERYRFPGGTHWREA